MDPRPRGRDKVWSINNARAWLKLYAQAGLTVYQQAAELARAFDVWDMLSHLRPGDHWVFDVAQEAVERLEAANRGGGNRAA